MHKFLSTVQWRSLNNLPPPAPLPPPTTRQEVAVPLTRLVNDPSSSSSTTTSVTPDVIRSRPKWQHVSPVISLYYHRGKQEGQGQFSCGECIAVRIPCTRTHAVLRSYRLRRQRGHSYAAKHAYGIKNATSSLDPKRCAARHLAREGERGGASRPEVAVAAAKHVGGAVGLLRALDLIEGACKTSHIQHKQATTQHCQSRGQISHCTSCQACQDAYALTAQNADSRPRKCPFLRGREVRLAPHASTRSPEPFPLHTYRCRGNPIRRRGGCRSYPWRCRRRRPPCHRRCACTAHRKMP